MFDLLDASIKAMLDDAAMGTSLPLYNADVSFVTPDKGYAPNKETVNLFLYETKENRELRDPAPIDELRDGVSTRRLPPLRVDCSYLVTTWSKKTGAARVAAEHRLLAQAFQWLSRFPVLAEPHLQAGGLGGQPFPPPTLVAQMDAGRTAGEFWQALGISPRPYFNLVATVALELQVEESAPLVTTTLTGYGTSTGGTLERRIAIGGRVLDPAGGAVADAWVRIEPMGVTTVTDARGRFSFAALPPGQPYTIRVRAVGLGEATRAGPDLASPSATHDVQF